ncbi:MAG: hypothetical protein ACRC20_05055 [Segniliparus sp.]|uniref:hypothetical protein n=1 Tax=Segniliparus sp. TaxID=2804064 RepID=UPI003F2A78A7
MSTTVRKAVAADAVHVHQLLLGSALCSANLPLHVRERLFRPVWGGGEDHFGYLVEDGDEVVGFLGTMFTAREAAGATHVFCELHSWHVREGLRDEGVRLFELALSAEHATFLHRAPSPEVYEISKRLGFQDVETDVLVISPDPVPPSCGGKNLITSDKSTIIDLLGYADQRILKDHEDLDCEHFLIRRPDDSEQLYVILKKMWRSPSEPFGRVLYCNDADRFAEALDELRNIWCHHFGLQCLVVDRDLLKASERAPFTAVHPRPVPSVFKSKALSADDVRVPLYTESLLTGLPLH